MKNKNLASDEQAQNVSEELRSYLSTGLNYALEQAGTTEEESTANKAKSTAHSIRHIIGKALPFDYDSKNMVIQKTDKHWFSVTDYMQQQLHFCVALGVDQLSESPLLDTPEVRHAFFKKYSRECDAIIKNLGWSLSEERQYLILLELEEPANAKELFLLTLKDLLFAAPLDTITPQGVERLFKDLLRGIDLPKNDELEGAAGDEQRQEALLHELCAFLTCETNGVNPVIKAISAYLFIVMLKPFPAANLTMGRLVYSWALFDSGLSLLAALPIIEFEEAWKSGGVPDKGYQPRIAYTDAVVSSRHTQDWTCYFEEMLGFLLHEVRSFRNKFISLELRRLRLMDILMSDASFNARQVDVLVEAVVHDDAEFSYDFYMEKQGVGYATAYDDLVDLKSRGFLIEKRKGKKAFYCADTTIRESLHAYLRKAVPEAYFRHYDEEGKLVTQHTDQRNEAMQVTGLSSRKRSLVRFSFPTFDETRRFAIKDSFSY